MAEWANLPEGLLDLILSKLFDQSRCNFRLVCRSWNAAAAASQYPNTPCLIHYHRNKRLLGFFQYKSYFYMSFPDDQFDEDAGILCSKHGWLLMCGGYYKDSSLFFYNPFNGYTKHIVDIYWTCKDLYNLVHFFHPPTSSDCFIVGVTLDEREMYIDVLEFGDKGGWSSMTCRSEYEFRVSNSAPVLHRGLVYFVGIRGEIATLDIESSAWNVYPKCLGFRKLRSKIRQEFLVKINGDEDDALYAVFMIHKRETVNVFRLLEAEMKWERVNDLGDKMLYLSLTASFGDVAKPKSMANTICLPIYDSHDNLLYYSLNIQRYHTFEGNHSYHSSIGLTRHRYGVTWIMPTPTQHLSTKPICWCSDDEKGEVDVDDLKFNLS